MYGTTLGVILATVMVACLVTLMISGTSFLVKKMHPPKVNVPKENDQNIWPTPPAQEDGML